MIVSIPAKVAHAPRRRPLGRSDAKAWNAHQLREFLDHAADHRLHAALWVSASTGIRRGELAGLHWGDIDLDERQFSVNRTLVSVGFESRSKTRTSRRCIDLDSTTVQSCATGATDAPSSQARRVRSASGDWSTYAAQWSTTRQS